LHGTDAFNRLCASIRATDKVKEQMQLRVGCQLGLQFLAFTFNGVFEVFAIIVFIFRTNKSKHFSL